MSTQIQFLRTDQVQLRPDPNVLANGMPLLNFNEQEPGLFFKARDGSLFKVGPTAVGDTAPNSGANGFAGNVKGETWLDTGGLTPMLKVYDGVQWVPSSDPGGVSSVALSMTPSIFDVAGSPITSAGVLSVTLQPQVRNRVLAGPAEGSAQAPTFRALGSDDIPGLDGSKIVAGFVNSARIPSLDATKITSGVFNSARIPGIDATKIVSGVLPYSFGGTGISEFPQNGELLIGGLSSGWRKTTLGAGNGIGIANGPGTIQLRVQPPGSNGELLFNNNGFLGADNALTFDGAANVLSLSGTAAVSGNVRMLNSGTPTGLIFESPSGNATVVAPSSIVASYTLTLPPNLPSATTDKVVTVSNTGQAAFAQNVTLNSVGIRDTLVVQDSFSGNAVTVRAPSLAANRDLTLPASYGTGGFVKTDAGGALSVSADVSAPTVTTEELIITADSPSRNFYTAASTNTVSSNGTYTLIQIPNAGTPVSVTFTVFVHDENATVGTHTLTVTYNAHYNGSTAVLSAAGSKVDSWTGTEPTFAVSADAQNFYVQTTTASGSNTLNFMTHYSYVINVAQ